jgi:hypothetical protein
LETIRWSRLGVYRRHDGLFRYVEEEITEWDDAPPDWVEASSSGIFASSQEAVLETLPPFPGFAPH